jgi:cell division protein FtsW
MALTRDDRSLVTEWWWTVSRQLLAATMALMTAGFVLSLAASPAVAVRKGLNPFHFVERHAVFVLIGAALVLAISILKPVEVKRLSLLLAGLALAGLIAVLLAGHEINGARRWLVLAGQQVQPSELFKPAFVVLVAGLLSRPADRNPAALVVSASLLLAAVLLLALEPDIGQALLLTIVWIGLYFLSGRSLRWMAGILALALVLAAVAYLGFGHVASRVDRFLHPASGDTYQMDRARESFVAGGWFGRGPGEGTIKSSLPDAHNDFIFAVVAEEYGVVACLSLLGLYAFIVWRAFAHQWSEPNAFIRLAVSGLAVLIAAQALINMGVNVGLLPAKGMTLPFISYGGSSLIGTSIAFGFLLALTRRRVDATWPAGVPRSVRHGTLRIAPASEGTRQA